ncbi:hypothetical protein HPB48_003524 [Haemaphysalis longicornis]|uniref:alkaline phosphatase n=1 Tax=Haemaphysalis longicornis TaxID=44386 RepID=A0A9J6G873_HAELO|nr:hypothetical protein HPB48_003524 [Haemaphysalis longicornis]
MGEEDERPLQSCIEKSSANVTVQIPRSTRLQTQPFAFVPRKEHANVRVSLRLVGSEDSGTNASKKRRQRKCPLCRQYSCQAWCCCHAPSPLLHSKSPRKPSQTQTLLSKFPRLGLGVGPLVVPEVNGHLGDVKHRGDDERDSRRCAGGEACRTYGLDVQTSDSANTATAYLCGVKANFRTLGVDYRVKVRTSLIIPCAYESATILSDSMAFIEALRIAKKFLRVLVFTHALNGKA